MTISKLFSAALLMMGLGLFLGCNPANQRSVDGKPDAHVDVHVDGQPAGHVDVDTTPRKVDVDVRAPGVDVDATAKPVPAAPGPIRRALERADGVDVEVRPGGGVDVDVNPRP